MEFRKNFPHIHYIPKRYLFEFLPKIVLLKQNEEIIKFKDSQEIINEFNKDNIVSLDWGIFTAYEVTKKSDICNECIIIVRSDDNEYIRRKISDYFMENGE